MNLEETQALSDEELKIKVAVLDGWRRQKLRYFVWIKDGETATPQNELPNYPKDLNAMHEAEEMMENKQLAIYSQIIDTICGEESIYYHISARQRAEAFVLTMAGEEATEGE